MLQPISPPTKSCDGTIAQHEQTRFVLDVLHAVALYRAVLESIEQTAARRVRMGESMLAQPANGDRPDSATSALPPQRARRPAPVGAPGLRPIE